MSQQYQDTWEAYTQSWKVESSAEKRALFEKSLTDQCIYHDPLTKTLGWSELEKYMIEFHEKIPGGHFVTTQFLAHSNKSIARWEMKDGNKQVLGDGVSYGEYGEDGKLISMTGFFETS